MLYKGVITNNKDPDQLGRYQVRIFGLVDGNTSGFGVSNNADLPWAEAVGSTAFGNIGGVGVSSIMHQGTWVWIMLMNDDPNIPVIIGTVLGNSKKDQDGFGDPDGKFPQQEGSDVLINGKTCAIDGSVFAAHGCLVHPAHSGVVVAPSRQVLFKFILWSIRWTKMSKKTC